MGYTEKTHKKSFLITLLKIILIIILIVITIVVGAYLYLKYALGIDVIDIKKKINLINAQVTESSIVTMPFTQEDAESGFIDMFGENNIYVKQGDDYIFNADNFTSSPLQTGGVYLTSQKFASCTNVFLNNLVKENTNNSEVVLDTQLKQISFSNLILEENKTKVDLDVVLKFDFNNLKKDFNNAGNFIYNIVSGIIPDYIYISAKAEVTLEVVDDCQTCSVSTKKVIINNLSESESNEIFDLFNRLYSSSDSTSMKDDIILQFTDMVLIGENNSFLNSINGFNNFSFEEKENIIYIVLN